MYEQFRNAVSMRLDSTFSRDQVIVILKMLDRVAVAYDFTRKETALAPIDQDPEILKLFIVSKKIEGLSTGTLYNYGVYLRNFFRTVNKPIEKITSNDVRAYLYYYQNKHGVCDRTLDRHRSCLSSFFSWACDEDYLKANVMKSIRKIKYEVKPREVLTELELEKVRDSCATIRDSAIIETLYSTACRVSELTALKKTDVNFEDRTVHLFGKGKKHRVSILNARAEIALRKYLESRNDGSDYLFVSEIKPYHRIKKEAVERIFKRISKEASLESGKRVTPHVIRHTAATIAANSGMPIQELQAILGHTNVNTTMIYAHTSPSKALDSFRRYT